jgi:hypothetical protein
MQFEFYQVEAGEGASVELRHIASADLEAFANEAKAAVERRFDELVGSNPDIGRLVVISPTIGDPPGAIVATEWLHALTTTTLQRRGLKPRSLIWVVDDSTGLH